MIGIGLAVGIEAGPALPATQRQAGQRILEGLFEGEKFEDAFGYARVEAQPAFVGTDRVIVLHPPTALDANAMIVVFPADAEADDTVGFG